MHCFVELRGVRRCFEIRPERPKKTAAKAGKSAPPAAQKRYTMIFPETPKRRPKRTPESRQEVPKRPVKHACQAYQAHPVTKQQVSQS